MMNYYRRSIDLCGRFIEAHLFSEERRTHSGNPAWPLDIPHSVAVLQAYLPDVLDEGEGLTPEPVKELRWATDLALRATKHTARAIGRSMAGMVAVEHHLWLTLTDIKEKDKTFLLDAPMSKDSLFGESVTAVVEKFPAAKP
ncbi:hypothetical protein DPX16_10451 [Anabarilius grahami]|uniref:Uncharacterized protein n=1 Tax=Anabarilius grahami TaxID=495550 RepID=A0A3N0Z7V2_ANAGA|nr:hypothetical protein DPX16_10451 [Anabarilius grahami]